MYDMTPADADLRAGWKQWLGLAVLALPTLLVALNVDSLLLALPQISVDLGASDDQQWWITSVYGFLIVGLLITMGALGDRIGHRRLLLIGGTVFALASILAAFSTGPEMLIAARALLGIAGAAMMPSTLALIVNMFRDDKQRGVAIAVWVIYQFAGTALGPAIGGLMTEYFSWAPVFLLVVPVLIVFLIVGPVLLPKHRNRDAGRLDLTSVALSLAAILPIVYGVGRLVADTTTTVMPIAALVVGAVCGVLFVRRQLRLGNPLLDLRLLFQRSTGLVVTALVLAGAATTGTSLLGTRYLLAVPGFPLLESVLWLAVGLFTGIVLTPVLTRLMTPPTAIAAGLVLSAVGTALLTQIGGTDGPGLTVGLAVLVLGTGPLLVLGIGIIVGSAPPEKAGSTAAMAETGNSLGGTLGLAVAGAVITVTGPPSGDSTDLVRAAHDAFTGGVNTIGLISGVTFVALAILIATRLRQDGAAGSPPRV